MKKLLLITAAALSAMFGSTAYADALRADWMAGKRGMMVHWLFGEPGRIDYYVNAFDINKFMADFDATKSDYLIFTVGQNAGVYASPNTKITAYAGAGHCPTRDLVGEIAAAVHARGKKFIAYLPCELEANTTLHEGFGWPAAGSGKNMSTFQSRWLEVITEWATRWGSNLDGWWIDGYTNQGGHWPDAMSGADEALWAAALRAGNSNAVITFNPGLAAKTPRAGAVLSDYLAGEINYPGAISDWTLTEFAEGTTSCRTHFLMPIDGFWGGYWPWASAYGANPYTDISTPDQTMMNRLSYVGQFPDPVVSESDLSAMITRVFAVNGAVTINIGVNASGTLNPASVALLAKMPGGSTSASADPGTTVESLIGSWSSTPMASDGSTFSKDGDLVYAYCTASENKSVNGITFTGLGSTPATASAYFEFAPAFNTTQNAESDGMSGDLQTIARLTWKNDEKGTGGYATMTFKGLTAGKRYCIQLYIHDSYCGNAAVFGPDAKSTVFYRVEGDDPKSGKDWTCGGVFTGVITAKAATHEITLNYATYSDRIELNALQVRCLGDAIVRPEDAPVAEESVINAMAWDALFPTAATYLDTETSFTLPYRQHSPTTADGVKYPLVIFLHGAGEVGTDNAKQVQTENDVIPITKYAMKHGDAFVLAPQCPGASGSDYSMTWSGANWNSYPMTRLETPTQPMAAVIKLVTDFMANNPVDPTRVYVTGLSMGGFGTWDLASRMSDTFAAAMPCCGGADPNAAALYDDGMAIRFFHGSSDNVVSPDFSRGMDTALTTAGIEHDYIEYSGVNHVDCWRKAYVDTDLNLEWLFGHIKGEEYVAPDHGDTTENAPLSTVANGGWLGWKLAGDGSSVVNRGTKVWAYAQNYSCRQGRFGANLVVNEVEFTTSGGFASDDTGIKNHISCDKTFGYGRDNFGTEDLSDGTSDFARMIKTGWEATGDQGPAQTYTLHGLTSGKMYLVQFIYHCASTDRAMLSVIAPGGMVSTRVNGWDANGQNLDENWRYGGSLVGVFTASGTDQELVITYSKTANYLLNAVQLREVTVDDLTKEPEIVYGTPTIGSVTPSVSGTTATLTLADVTVGQNGGCYQVWLAYAEDGMTLGSETAALISQQSASCAVEIKNLTAGKKYNYSLYVKNEGNVVSSKKTGSFTVPGGEDPGPVNPPSGDESGDWIAIPMTSNGSVFSTDGDLVFAFSRDRGDPGTTYENSSTPVMFNYLNSLTDTVTKYHPWQHGGEAIDGPYGNGLQPADYIAASPVLNGARGDCGDEGLGSDMSGFGSMLGCMWTGPSLSGTDNKATFTFKRLTSGHKYLVEFFIHDHDQVKSITSPDGKATIYYGGTGWQYGGVLRGTFTAVAATQDIVLTYSDPGSYGMGAIQLRDLGVAPEDPDDPQDETIASAAAKLGVGRWLAMPLTGNPADIITEGTMATTTVAGKGDKKLSGAKSYGQVNGVDFGGSWSGDNAMISSPHNVSQNKDFGTAATCGIDGQYGQFLKNAFDSKNNDGPCTFAFSGLDSAKTYLVQYIIHSTDAGHTAAVTDAEGTKTIHLGATDTSDDWYYGGTLIHVFKPAQDGTYSLVIDYRKNDAAANAIVNAFQVREIEAREEPDDPVDPPAPPPVYTLTIPAKTGLVIGSVTTNGTAVAETGGAYSIVSNTEVTITFAAASGYELDDNDGVVTKTIESNYTFVDADYPAVKEQGGGDDPVDPPAGEDVWTAIPMTSNGSVFSTDGDLVFAFSRDRGDPGTTYENSSTPVTFNYLNSLTDTVTKYHPWQHGGEAIDGPYGNGLQPADYLAASPVLNGADGGCGDEGLGSDMSGFGSMLTCMWTGPSLSDTGNKATFTFKRLTSGHRYLVEFFIHRSNEGAKAITAPDGTATIYYGGTGWQYGGLLRGTFTAAAATHDVVLTYSDPGSYGMGAIQLRDLGEAGDDPEPVEADPDTSWMKGSFGVSFHWTAKVVNNNGTMNWEQAVNNFDAEKFADSVESFGAQHVIFTTAHAWQQLPCPCVALDNLITGRTTERDLLKGIIDELTNRNIRVIFYYNHSCNHNEDQAWDEASGYDDITDAQSMTNFADNICAIVRELSLRYGDGVSAWWFDSATSVDDSQPWPNNKTANNVAGLTFPWDNLFAAARAGNPHAAVAVNWDVHAVDQHGLSTDYLSGETEKIDAYGNFFPFAPEGFQDHIWTRMDSSDWFWQGGDVENYGSRFTEEQLAWWKVSHRDAGRMATLNLVIDEAGNINPVVAQQLVNAKTIGKVWSQGRYDPTKWQAAPAVSNLVLGLTDDDGTFEGPSRPGKYGLTYDKTGISVLTDGTIPTTPVVAGEGITAADSAHLFSVASGSVFSWTLKEASDIYGLNIYTRGTRVGTGDKTDGASDAIVVTNIAVKYEGSSEWSSIDVPDVLFGKSATESWGDGISGGALGACLKDGTGAPLAQNVAAVRVSFGALENNQAILAEIEVIGCKSAPQEVDIPTAAAALLPGYWLAAPLTGDPSDFITEGTLAVIGGKNMAGSRQYESDNTVQNIPFGGSNTAEKHMVGDPAFSGNKDCGTGATCGLEGAYGNILKYGWSGASAVEYQTIAFSGLDSEKTYLVQYIVHGELNVTNRYDEVTDAAGTHRIWQSAATEGEEWYYGGTLIHVFRPAPDGSYVLQIAHRSVDEKSGTVSYQNGLMNAYQIREVTREIPEPPAPPPVYTLTIPAKTGLVLDSVKTNGTSVAETEGVYSIVSNTEVTITFAAASGYELDGNNGVVTKTIEANYTFGEDDYPAVKEQQGEEPEEPDKPVDPQPGELVNGRANMKGWAMKRISTASKVASEEGFGWSAGDNPKDKSYSSVTESVMTFTDAQVVNTIQLFAPKSENNTIPQVVNQMPSALKIYGSNDGSAWTELLSVSGEADWLSMECRYYTFNNTTAYTQYKLEVVSTVGGGSAKLGVYNYYFTKPVDPTTPWVYANNKLSRGDQELTMRLNGSTLQVDGNVAEGSVYDLDFTAGIVDGDGNPLSYKVNLEQKLQNNRDLTRLIGGNVVSRINGWGCQNCWYLNELSLGEAFTGFAERQAFENDYSLEWLDMESSPVETLPSNTFTCNYNLKGDLVLHVKTFSSKFNGSRISSITLDEVVTYGDNNYFAPFEGCTFLTNITLGANLTTINCKQAFGKISVPVSIYWNSAPPEFTQDSPDVFNDKNFVYHKVTSYLPLSKRTEWESFASSATKFKLDLPVIVDGEGTWYTGNTSFEQYIRWWDDRPPAKSGFILIVR